ncbi:MBL fold metallo-hydrolase [Chloroflexota bacterium]
MRLTTNIFVETEYRGANVSYITTEQGIVLIDTPQKPTEALDWQKKIAAEEGEIKYLINTESHPDHFAGNSFFDAPVIAHQKTRKALLETDVNQLIESTKGIDPEGSHLLSGYEINTPVITFSEKLSLYLGSHTFHMEHLPGHTAGQIGVHIPEERVLFTGDNVMYRLQTFLYSANPYDWLQSLDRIGEFDVDYIVCGHGKVCNREYLPEWASFIREWVDTVQQAINQGWTKEEAVNRISLLDRYPTTSYNKQRGPEIQRINTAYLYDFLSSPE